MTYWMLNLFFLVPALIVAAAAAVKAGPSRRGRFGTALAGTAVVLLILTAVFDNLMIGAGLFGYNPDRISGVWVGLAPLEDFAYAAAAVLLLPALWTLLTPHRPGPGGSA